ncbi:MAG: hypothetical protein PHQ34_09200 [Methanothrix sp.]|nr:hypothetical protein [Methanothrix sp.]
MIEDTLSFSGLQSSLDKIISFSENDMMHSEKLLRWDEFGGLWSQEDRTNLNGLRKRITIDSEGKKILTLPLTRQEKAWAANFVWRVMLAEKLL